MSVDAGARTGWAVAVVGKASWNVLFAESTALGRAVKVAV